MKYENYNRISLYHQQEYRLRARDLAYNILYSDIYDKLVKYDAYVTTIKLDDYSYMTRSMLRNDFSNIIYSALDKFTPANSEYKSDEINSKVADDITNGILGYLINNGFYCYSDTEHYAIINIDDEDSHLYENIHDIASSYLKSWCDVYFKDQCIKVCWDVLKTYKNEDYISYDDEKIYRYDDSSNNLDDHLNMNIIHIDVLDADDNVHSIDVDVFLDDEYPGVTYKFDGKLIAKKDYESLADMYLNLDDEIAYEVLMPKVEEIMKPSNIPDFKTDKEGEDSFYFLPDERNMNIGGSGSRH